MPGEPVISNVTLLGVVRVRAASPARRIRPRRKVRAIRVAREKVVAETTVGPRREENPDPAEEAVVVIARGTREAIVVNLPGLDALPAEES